jgi:general secretion pathway protein G
MNATQDFKIKNEGFSLLELIIAITIIGILAVVIAPNFMKWVGRAKETRTEQALNTIKLAINSYQADTGSYPKTLMDLIRKPGADVKRWRGPYLDQTDVPEDGWNQPFIYRVNPKGSPRPYELYAESPEGEKYSVWEIGQK